MIERLFFFLYSFLYSVALLFLLPYESMRRPRDLRKRWLKERIGIYKAEVQKWGRAEAHRTSEPLTPRTSKPKTIWIHAVSVGEVIASVPLIQAIVKRIPSLKVILTTVTDTGQKVAKERLTGSVRVFYAPFDLPFSLKRFIKAMRPSLYISMETEIWPNLFYLLRKEGIPVLIMNGRVSDDSFRGYKKIRFFMKRVLDCVDLFCMQEDIYGERIKALGAPVERIRIMGNLKFDIWIDEYRDDWVRNLKRPIILAGSTHDGEEEIIIDAFERLREELGDMTLIIAPRHPERFSKVEGMLNKRGINYIKRSEIIGANLNNRVILLDVIGELASLYGTCDLAIIGGTFSGRGGHNPLEPAFWGKPILCGEDMSNFPFIEEFYRDGAAIRTSREGLCNDMKGLLLSEDKRRDMGKRAKEIYKRKAGSIERSFDLLKRYLELP